MKFDDSLAESLHVALRKGCDSSASSAAWNLIYLLKPSFLHYSIEKEKASRHEPEIKKAAGKEKARARS